MPTKVAQDIARQARQQMGGLAEEVFETAKKTPGEMAGVALEQVGIPSGQSPSGKKKKQAPGPDQKGVEELKEAEERKVKPQIELLETAMRRLRQQREEQLRQRREPVEEAKPPPQPEVMVKPPGEKPQRGSMFLRRKKGQTEMAAGKRSG